MEKLVKDLNALCDRYSFHTGWYLKDLRSEKEANRLGGVVVPSASVRKIAILMAAMKASHEGRLSLGQRVPIEARYQNNDSGCFQHLTADFSISLRDALVMMIIVSDNTCTGAVADLLGLEYINSFSRSMGMKGTTHRHGFPPLPVPKDHPVEYTNATTPNDVGLLLDLMLKGSEDAASAKRLGCTSDLCRLALDILSWQKLKTRLPSLLPPGTKVAHKTGTGVRNHNDAGIVYLGEEPLFILSAFTEHVPPELEDGTPGHAAAARLIGEMSRLAFDTLSGRKPMAASGRVKGKQGVLPNRSRDGGYAVRGSGAA
ncbi:MAG: serine hydrolase [SAR202 cluster bacterium]|nr:serine hydrolase [SAR202 cluster bacterium]